MSQEPEKDWKAAAARYRKEAADLRNQAEEASSNEFKNTLLQLAKSYDTLAKDCEKLGGIVPIRPSGRNS